MSKAAELAKWGEVTTNGQVSGRRNIIINGAMQVAQRSASVAGLGATSGYYTLDRNRLIFSGTAGRLTMTQTAITDLPGFANCLKLDCTTADTSIAAGEILILAQNFEGQDLQQFKKGTSDAEKITVSFYIKGNANATYTCELYDNDNSRSIAQEFSVTSSWSRVVLTFNNETSNALDDDTASSLSLHFWLHGGSTFAGGTFASNTWHATNANRASDSQTSFFDSDARTFFITGVQMEVGSVATPFEHRSYGEELALCQRYFQVAQSGTNAAISPICNGWQQSSSDTRGILKFSAMRVAPTIAQNTAANYFLFERNGASDLLTELSLAYSTPTSCLIYDDNTSSGTAGHGGGIYTNNASAYLHLLAEL
tara:strand:+ start:382 stop:1485 length:1104 start_codon:yes stop_codon:yes gene_type:complete